MAPTSGFPEKKDQTTWSLRKPWEMPKCAITRKIIWPWQLAWRRRIDHLYGGKVFASTDRWVTQDQYLLLKLKGELYTCLKQ